MNMKRLITLTVAGTFIIVGCAMEAAKTAPSPEPVLEEVAEPASEPVMEETAEPAEEPALEEMAEPAAEPALEEVAEPAPEAEEETAEPETGEDPGE